MTRKALICALSLVVAAAFLGCGRSRKTVAVPGGTATVKTEKGLRGDKQTVEVNTKEGKATVTTEEGKKVTEADLGVPVYPGAKSETSGTYEGGQGGQMGKLEQYTLSTKDSFEKVADFYKNKIKNPQSSYVGSSGDQKTAMFAVEQGKQTIAVQVMYNEKEGKTIISVTKTTKQ